MAEDPTRTPDEDAVPADDDAVAADATSAASAGAPPDAAGDGAADAPETAGALGARLRAAREALGLTPEDLAADLRVPPRTVLALEAEDFDALPGATFVRGYLRAWARRVDLPADELVAAHEARVGALRPRARPSPRIETAGPAEPLAQSRPGTVMALASAALLVALAAGGTWVWFDREAAPLPTVSSDGPAPATPVTPGAGAAGSGADGPALPVAAPTDPVAPASGTEPEAAASPGPAPGVAEPGTGAAAPAVAPSDAPTDAGTDGPDARARPPSAAEPAASAPVTGPPQAGSTEARSVEADAPAPDAADVEVAADDDRTRIFAGGQDHLAFRFSGECWVEIRDADDIGVHSDLHRAGEVVDVYGRAPFRVVLGYAPAVTLAYNDAPVPLAPHTRNDVASLVLGR